MAQQRRYPDPARVAALTPTSMPPGFPPQLTSKDAGRLYPVHDHDAFMNTQGDGTTSVTASHYHRIRGGRIQADASDGHTHRLTGLPAGAG